VVDDDKDTRDVTEELLSDAGYVVRGFDDGAAALRYLLSAREPPSIVMTDLAMPCMDGHELIATMKAHPNLSAIPVLVVTGSIGFSWEGIPVVAKPAAAATLLAQIASLLASARPAAG
jgi:CheY-like chemotaxis protein